MGTMLMGLTHTKHSKDCEITKQELPAHAIVLTCFFKKNQTKNLKQKRYERKMKKDKSLKKLASLWSIHRCSGTCSTTVFLSLFRFSST